MGNVKIDLIESRFHREGNDNSGDVSIPDPTQTASGMKYVTDGHKAFTDDEIKADAVTYATDYLAVKGKNMVPGRGVAKCPYVVNTGANDAYIRVRVMVPSAANNDFVAVKDGGVITNQWCSSSIGTGEFIDGKGGGWNNAPAIAKASVTKDGVTYGEFTSGKNSGWLYKVNGILPSIPLTQCGIKNGDSILWYYTLDWTKDPDAGKMAGGEVTAADVIKLIDAIGTVSKDSGNAIAAARTAYNKLSDAEKALVTNYDKLLSAETAYAEIQKAQQEKTNTEGVTGWKKTYQDALDAVKTDQLAFGSEWLVIALARSGRPVPDSYYDSVVKAVQDAKGELSDKKFTEYSRTILALTAIGKDPSNVGGYDLLVPLADLDRVTAQGVNAASKSCWKRMARRTFLNRHMHRLWPDI